MPIPVWVPGQVLTAADVNGWMVPNAAFKNTDQSVTSSTTLINDTVLVVPVAANSAYLFQCYLDYEGGTGGSADLKFQWVFPGGAQIRYGITGLGSAGGSLVGNTFAAGAQALRTNGAGVLMAAVMTGTVWTGVTAGTLQLQWAQNTINGTATIVHALSALSLQRIY